MLAKSSDVFQRSGHHSRKLGLGLYVLPLSYFRVQLLARSASYKSVRIITAKIISRKLPCTRLGELRRVHNVVLARAKFFEV